jgi:acetyl-CoA C-acetyltransferase
VEPGYPGRVKERAAFVAGAVRSPIGKFGGALAPLGAPELGGPVAAEAVRRAGLPPEAIDSVVFGHARQAGAGPNPARQVGRRAGLRDEVPAYTVNQACASGLRAIVNAAAEVLLGEADAVLAGGMESMSNTPYLLAGARWGYRMGNAQVVDAMYRDGFLCPLCGLLMGETAENLVERYGIGREEQDRYAVETQRRCERARTSGRFKDEVLPLEVTTRQGRVVVSEDEHPRDGVTLESLARLEGVFRKGGSVHAGNSSGITDGAAAMVVLSEEAARRHGVEPLARIVAWTQAGVDPALMGLGPVPALNRLLARTGLRLDDLDLVELNEAFAAQVIACGRELGLDPERLNVNGGAIALGHPIGATGARIATTLLHEMSKRSARRGVATLCVSGGMGMAVLFERP